MGHLPRAFCCSAATGLAQAVLVQADSPPNRYFYGPFRRRCRAVIGIAITAGGRRDSMTYCCGILVRDGMVMIADTRTNAGLDNISTFRSCTSSAIPASG